jgi:Uma2 family endonuclease
VSVVCGELRYADDQRDTIVNPRLIVEVFSPATSSYDRGDKPRLYRMLTERIALGRTSTASRPNWDRQIS